MLDFEQADDGYLDELASLIAIPSVSGDATPETMRAAAQWVALQLSFVNGRVDETAGHPVVRGEWLGTPGAPTVLVYGHYDVHSAGDPAEWDTPPFGCCFPASPRRSPPRTCRQCFQLGQYF